MLDFFSDWIPSGMMTNPYKSHIDGIYLLYEPFRLQVELPKHQQRSYFMIKCPCSKKIRIGNCYGLPLHKLWLVFPAPSRMTLPSINFVKISSDVAWTCVRTLERTHLRHKPTEFQWFHQNNKSAFHITMPVPQDGGRTVHSVQR